MRFTATMFNGQPQTKVYKFGYKIDASNNVAWKSEGIKNLMDFMHRAENSLMDPDTNRFSNIVLWLEVNAKGIGALFSNVGTNYSEINIKAVDDNSGSNASKIVSFKSLKLLSASPATPPPGDLSPGNLSQCQLLHFGFDKASASWLDG